MSNTTEKNSESEAGNPKKTRSQEKKSADPKARTSGQAIAVVALIISIAALGSIAYVGWRGILIEKQMPETLVRINQLDNQLTRQHSQLTETVKAFRPLQNQASNLEQRGERLLDRVDQLSAKVRDLEGSARLDWHLAEVEYMLRLANQRLLMASDMQGAKNMLTSADEMLRDIDDYNLHAVREALAEDIAVLNAVPLFDQEGIYLKLQALVEQIPSLELFKMDQFKPDIPEDSDQKQLPEDTGWKSTAVNILYKAWQNFAELFRFTSNRDRPVQALLTPEQEAIIRQNLRLLIEQSKLALLAQQQNVFQDSLTQAEKWLTKYFALGGAPVKSVLTELEQLKNTNIDPELPNISRALKALKHQQRQSPLNKDSQEKNPETTQPMENSAPASPAKISPAVDVEAGEQLS